jgi:hypothetical protein
VKIVWQIGVHERKVFNQHPRGVVDKFFSSFIPSKNGKLHNLREKVFFLLKIKKSIRRRNNENSLSLSLYY